MFIQDKSSDQITNTGTLTLLTLTHTFVGQATSNTLTNNTLTSDNQLSFNFW